ncbi:hypothetical protein ABK040_005228 [Willaertia magna]
MYPRLRPDPSKNGLVLTFASKPIYTIPNDIKPVKLRNFTKEESEEEIDYNEKEQSSNLTNTCSVFYKNRDNVIEYLNNIKEKGIQAKTLLSILQFFENPENDITIVKFDYKSKKTTVACLIPYLLGAKNILIISPDIESTKEFLKENIKLEAKKANASNSELNIKTVEDLSFTKNKDPSELNSLVILNTKEFIGQAIDFYGSNVISNFDVVVVYNAESFSYDTWWKGIMNHFISSKIIFLTTAFKIKTKNEIKDVLDTSYYCKSLVRDYSIEEIGTEQKELNEAAIKEMLEAIEIKLKKHNSQDPCTKHKALISTLTMADSQKCYNFLTKNYTAKNITLYNSKSKPNLDKAEIIIVCGSCVRDIELPAISVIGVLKNIQKKTTLTDTIGKCMKKVNEDDPVKGAVLVHNLYKISMDRIKALTIIEKKKIGRSKRK